MLDIDTYKRRIEQYKDSLDPEFAKTPIGCRNFLADETIEDVLNDVSEKISRFERSPKKVGDGYLTFFKVSETLYELIEEIDHSDENVPEEVNQLFQDAVTLCGEYGKKFLDEATEEAKRLLKKGRFRKAADTLRIKMWAWEVGLKFCPELKPSEECIKTLEEAIEGY